MRIRIHRGAKEIGGTCIEIACDGSRLALDFGLPLDGDADDAALVPQISGDGLKAILLSHPHIDHYGLLHHLPEGIPVVMGDAARRIINAAVPFTGQALPRINGPTFVNAQPLEIGPFRVTPYLTDHSAYDAYSILVEAKGKKLLYSGDFRVHGRKAKLVELMMAHPPKDIDVLLMEGSSLSRLGKDGVFPQERELENELFAKFQATQGLCMMHTSAQNIDRVVTLYRACKRANRTMVIDLYAAAIFEATGNKHIPQSSWPGVALYVPASQQRLIKRNSWFDLMKRHSTCRIYANQLAELASKSVLLFRPLMMADLEKGKALSGASFIYSQWQGYLEKGTYVEMQAWLDRHNIDITHIPMAVARCVLPVPGPPMNTMGCCRFQGHFVKVVIETGGSLWRREGDSVGNSRLRRSS